VQVTFTPGAPGSAPTSYYQVTGTDVTDPTSPPRVGAESDSPVTVGDLTNGHTYTFTVVAVTQYGSSPPSAASPRITAGIAAGIAGTPPAGTVGRPYQFSFTVTGAPTPTVQFDNDATPLPAGLTFDPSTATISGTPTQEGSFYLSFHVFNAVGSAMSTPTLVVGKALGAEPTPPPTSTATSTPTSSTTPTTSGTPANPPAAVNAAVVDQGGFLASTGAATPPLVPFAVLLLVIGTALLTVARRRLSGGSAPPSRRD
jgi:Putative Ig domain/Fibronectin type III domain